MQSLKERLNQVHEFPTVYLFKFVVPSDNHKIAQVSSLFGEEAQITLKESSQGKYTSLSIKTVVISADEVVNKYQEAVKIEGLIAL